MAALAQAARAAMTARANGNKSFHKGDAVDEIIYGIFFCRFFSISSKMDRRSYGKNSVFYELFRQ